MLEKLFNFIRGKKTTRVSLLLASTWSRVDSIEYVTPPNKGELVYICRTDLYYRIIEIINYVDFDGKVLVRYILVEPIDGELVKPGNKK